MIAEYVLIAWGAFAAPSLAIDATAMYGALAGRHGQEVIALTRAHAARSGGLRRWVLKCFAYDIIMPWLVREGLLRGYRSDRG